MIRLSTIAALAVFTTPAVAQLPLGGPITVLDCSPCGTVIGGINSAHASTISTVNSHVSVETTKAAALIVNAVTQSTAQITGAIDKNSAILKTLADATITASYIQSNAERAADLRYQHAPAPQACKSPSIGLVLRNSDQTQRSVNSELAKRNKDWNNIGSKQGWSSATSARELKRRVDVVQENNETDETTSLSNILKAKRLEKTDLQLAQLYAQQITNPTPKAEITIDGEADNAEAWAYQEKEKREIELSQSAFEEAISRRAPTTELPASVGDSSAGLRSFIETMDAEAKRRFFDPSWAPDLQRAPPDAVSREMAMINAQQLYITWELFKELEKIKLLLAAQLSEVERDEE